VSDSSCCSSTSCFTAFSWGKYIIFCTSSSSWVRSLCIDFPYISSNAAVLIYTLTIFSRGFSELEVGDQSVQFQPQNDQKKKEISLRPASLYRFWTYKQSFCLISQVICDFPFHRREFTRLPHAGSWVSPIHIYIKVLDRWSSGESIQIFATSKSLEFQLPSKAPVLQLRLDE
jgi:hypothetical protein